MATPKVVTSWDLSVDGVGFLGKAESIQLPEVEEITEEIRGAGSAGPRKIPMGVKLGDCTLKVTLGEGKNDSPSGAST